LHSVKPVNETLDTLHRNIRRARIAGFTHGVTEPASRFRFIQYKTWLENLGWDVTHLPCRPPRPWNFPVQSQPWCNIIRHAGHEARKWNRWRDIRSAGNYDVVFLNRDLLNGDPAWEARLKHHNPRIVFDFDDALYEGSGARQAEWMCRNAAWVTAGNERLASWARTFTDHVTIIPTVVDVNTYEVTGTTSGTFRVGWCGSDQSIEQNLIPFIPMIIRLQKKLGFEFVIMTKPKPVLNNLELKWSHVEWSAEHEQTLGRYFDAGIMPLPDTPYTRGKCGIKLIQYMACGLPVVASPVGINDQLCGDGRGFTADREAEWSEALSQLMHRQELRREMGRNGRVFCQKHFHIGNWAPVLSDVFFRITRG